MIMKISKVSTLVAAAVAASVISVAAFAADSATLPQQKVDFGANVALAGISGPSMEDLATSTATSQEKKKGSLGYGAFVGYGYQVMPQFYLGAELGYQDNGHTKYNYSSSSASANVKIKSRMMTLLATADYFVTPNWDFVGKFGPAYVWQQVNVNGTTTLYQNVQSSKTHKVAPYLSLGTGYHFDNNVSLSIAYDHLFGSSKGSLDMAKPKIRSVNAIQLTVGYTLPF
jgi:opacity protein-like surface antigen